MKTDRLSSLFMELSLLYSDIARFKLQKRLEIGFSRKEKFDKLNKLLEKTRNGINKFEDISFNSDSTENPEELVRLIKALAKIDDFLPEIPEEAQNELYFDIQERVTSLIDTVSQYNYLKEPSLF